MTLTRRRRTRRLVRPRRRGRPVGDPDLRAAAVLPPGNAHRGHRTALRPAEEPGPARGTTGGRRTTWTAWWTPAAANSATPGARFDGGNRPSAGQLASRLVTGIRLRNFLTVVNNYYDDMAWLALSTLRLEKLAEETRRPGRPRQRPDPEEPDAAVRFRLHGRPGRRHVLEHEAGLQEHAGHGTGGALLRPDREHGQGPGAAGLAPRQAVRPRPRHVPGRAADRQQRRGGAGSRHLHLQPGPGPGRAAGARRRGEPGPGRRAGGRRGPPPHAPRRRWHRAGPPRCSAATERATAACSPGSWPGTLRWPQRTDGFPTGRGPRRPPWSSTRREALLGGPPRRGPGGAAGPPGRAAGVFSRSPRRRRAEAYPAGAAVELSTQLQAWMVLEAAAAITPDPPPDGRAN